MKKIVVLLMVAVMLFAVAAPVFAVESPDKPGTEFSVTIDVITDGGNASKVVNEDGTVVLTATPDENYKFVKWDISGEYEIVSGTLTGSPITIKPVSDVTVKVSFDGKQAVKPTDATSPETGVQTVSSDIFAILMLVSVAGAAYAIKRGRANA